MKALSQNNNSAWTQLINNSTICQNKNDAHDVFVVSESGLVESFDKAVLSNLCYKAGVKLSEIIQVVRKEYAPHGYSQFYEKKGLPTFNEFQPPVWMRRLFFNQKEIGQSELPEVYFKFFSHLFTTDISREYALDWLANSLKRRNLTFLVLIGTQGTGKGVFGAILNKLHEFNYLETRDQLLHSQFNSHLANKTLIYLDEVSIKDSRAIDRLKALGNDLLEIEAKGQNARSIVNYASVVISSNREDAIELESDNERRYSLVDITDVPLRQSKTFFEQEANAQELKALVDELTDPENIEKLAQFLWHRQIINNMASVFKSNKLDEIIAAQRKDWELTVEQFIHSNPAKEILLKTIQDEILSKHKIKVGREKLKLAANRSCGLFQVKNSNSHGWVLQINVDKFHAKQKDFGIKDVI